MHRVSRRTFLATSFAAAGASAIAGAPTLRLCLRLPVPHGWSSSMMATFACSTVHARAVSREPCLFSRAG